MWFSMDCLLYVPTATSFHIFLEMQKKRGLFEEEKNFVHLLILSIVEEWVGMTQNIVILTQALLL